jgi:succinyl-CoA synthetase alpha subunit
MSILVNKATKVICQGFTGTQGTFHSQQAIEYGTNMVGGVTPGKGGSQHLGLPVFNTVLEAKAKTGCDASIIYVPPIYAMDSIMEAIDAGIEVIVAVTDGVPVQDIARIKKELKYTNSRVIGPNCPGIITPSECKMGIMPGYVHKPGRVGIVSRSGTLSYEAATQTTAVGLGQSTVVGIGGDPVKGTTAAEALALFDKDPETTAVLYLGEIGGSEERFVAEYAAQPGAKPVAALIVGATAPRGKKMGHAAALIGSKAEGHDAKVAMLRAAGVHVASGLSDVVAATKAAVESGAHRAQHQAA